MDEALFKRIVKQVIKNEPNERDAILSQTDAVFLLGGGGDTCCSPRSSVFGYPSHPLYAEISNMLLIWIKTRRCPTLDLPSYNLLDEKHYVESRAATVQSLTPMLLGLVSLWDIWTHEEIAFRIRDVLKTLGRRGLLDLLGVRRTVGSADRWPVDRGVLLQSFSQTHGPGTELSVGARALAKHHHRDSSTSWWGTSTGTEKARNEHALRMMNRILDEASWINIHNLPGDLTILEVRQPEGYGVRWTADGSSFRGFVEPQMVGGHDVGWKH